MTPDLPPLRTLPDPVQQTLRDFESTLSLTFRLMEVVEGGEKRLLYLSPGHPAAGGAGPDGATGFVRRSLQPSDGPHIELELAGGPPGTTEVVSEALADLTVSVLRRSWEFSQEVRFFTFELTERYEEINLLYSIAETLGSVLNLEEAAKIILTEVCDVLGARRGSLWVFEAPEEVLRLVASVGEDGPRGPLPVDHPTSITARSFREGRALLVPEPGSRASAPTPDGEEESSLLSVPIRYTPPSGDPRTVGVMNMIGSRRGGGFTASDQKLLAAVASQVGSAIENHRLIRESLEQERTAREMELAHHLQMRLLPSAEEFQGAEVAARVRPAVQVGGDFFHLLHPSEDTIGVMIGDVSTHGFPAALIMALCMSAASIYAMEGGGPGGALRRLDDALREELESTEMYLSLFYAVLDPKRGLLTYANAGHPHAFLLRADGSSHRLEATDPPVGIAGEGSYGEQVVPWETGQDLLLLFTDGLSDTLAEGARGSGEEVVLEIVAANRDRPAVEIVDALFRRVETATPTIPADDVTALVLRR